MPSVLNIFFTLLSISHVTYGTKVRQLWEFSNTSQWVENIGIRPSGHLLLNTFDQGKMYTIDPSTENPAPSVAIQMPGVTALTGITEIEPDLFAISGGNPNATSGAFLYGSGKIFVVDFRGRVPHINNQPLIRRAVEIPDSKLLNGIASLPLNPHIVLSVDSKLGCIYRTDTLSGHVDVIYKSDKLSPTPGTATPVGANGLKVRGGYLYLTNSEQYFLARLKVSEAGNVLGPLEIIKQLPTNPTQHPDDFWIAQDGTFYVAAFTTAVLKITAGGQVSTVVDESGTVYLDSPTSCHLSKDEKTLYVSTSGGSNGKGGQLIEIDLVSK
ncbi:hypothetical protein J3E68DRAFT_423396 [Trichoderma sp. SZMC 28012]